MPGTTHSFQGTSTTVPVTGDKTWGTDVSYQLNTIISSLNDAINKLTVSGTDYRVQIAPAYVDALVSGGSLTVRRNRHRVSMIPGGTLSAVTSIANGTFDGQKLTLIGTSDTNYVRILDGTNTKMNGNVILKNQDQITLVWDSTDSIWIEQSRSM